MRCLFDMFIDFDFDVLYLTCIFDMYIVHLYYVFSYHDDVVD